MAYSKIEIYGGCDINYLNVQSSIENNSQILDMMDFGLSLPSWEDDTLMTVNYQNSIDASPVSITSGKIVGFQLYRYDVDKEIMYHIANTSQNTVRDYNVKCNNNYQYYIFPIIEEYGFRFLGSPIVTDYVTPIWDRCMIIGLLEAENDNEYVVDGSNIWTLQLNVEQEQYALNMDKTFTDGFDRFAKRTQGKKKYVTSGINSIIGTLKCSGDSVDISAKDIERWEDFCHSSNLKLLSDMHGRLIPIDIKTVSTGYLIKNYDSPIVTNISFVQMADASQILIHEKVDKVADAPVVNVNNIITNGDFSQGLVGWNLNSNCTYEIIDGGYLRATWNVTDSENLTYTVHDITPSIVGSTAETNQVIYMVAKVRGNTNNISYPGVAFGHFWDGSYGIHAFESIDGCNGVSLNDGNWHTMTVYDKTYYDNGTQEITSVMFTLWGFGSNASDVIDIKDIAVFNLTEIFGRGDEPPKDWCDKHLVQFA